ncbi:LmbU family transcriptional regulator [Actinoallomurus sp. CA-150999]|uniref:LmbU family transcriptional regulator n=1 Tax=Actinoallomurus sp. CA-150999 TaxID=3239887 RepID=UPI003D8C486A
MSSTKDRATAGARRAGRHIFLGRRVTATRTRLNLPPRLPLETWREIGEQLVVLCDASAWWHGDWLLYGQGRYPDRYRRAIEDSGLDYQTLRNYAWVARKFSPSRRRAALSLQHHAEVAGLPAEQQEYWLDLAEKEGWPTSRLRKHIQDSRRCRRGALTPEATVSLRIDTERRRRWRDAAEREGRRLPEWIAEALDGAAETALRSTPPPPGDEVERSVSAGG